MRTLSHIEEKTPEQRQKAAMFISMSQKQSGRIMEHPDLITDIRELRLQNMTWKDVTLEMKEELIGVGLAEKIDFFRKKHLKMLAGTVAKAHNDRRDFDPAIRQIKTDIRADDDVEGMIMDAIVEKGSYSAPLRIPEIRDALTAMGLRPREIKKVDGRYNEGTVDARTYAIRDFNRLARVAFGEMHLEEIGDFDPYIWEEK
jgi:hypothetical protein